jgi:hypothetical protein
MEIICNLYQLRRKGEATCEGKLAKVKTSPHCAILGATCSNIWGNHFHPFKSKTPIAPRAGAQKLANLNLMHYLNCKKKLKSCPIRSPPKPETTTWHLNCWNQPETTSTTSNPKVLPFRPAEKRFTLAVAGRLSYKWVRGKDRNKNLTTASKSGKITMRASKKSSRRFNWRCKNHHLRNSRQRKTVMRRLFSKEVRRSLGISSTK